MLDTPQHDLSVAELDPDPLSTHFNVQTNLHVITGAPCCGKTTLIDQLASKGFQTVAESARQYIDKELAKGRTFEEIFVNKDDAHCMMVLQLHKEQELHANDRLFLDRGLPDCLASCRLIGIDPNSFLAECFQNHYASVFILDRLPLELDSARLDDNPMANYLDEQHARDYASLGYDVVRVPVLPPQQRLSFVLETLSAQGAI